MKFPGIDPAKLTLQQYFSLVRLINEMNRPKVSLPGLSRFSPAVAEHVARMTQSHE